MKPGLIELRWHGPAKFRGSEALVQSIVSTTMYTMEEVLDFTCKNKALFVDWGSLAILEYDMKESKIPRKWIKSKWV